jgi:tRNA-specific 2-thiouridylase
MKRVVVGLSGGVDSSKLQHTFARLRRLVCLQKNWHDDSVTISNDCPWLEDSNDA